MKDNHLSPLSPRENFLMGLLAKLIKEYKTLFNLAFRVKPLKIIEIAQLTNVPGETSFVVQVVNKNSVTTLSAAEIISKGYNLDDFSDFHAEMIRQAAQGSLIKFLKLTNHKPATYQIISKKLDRERQEYIFTLQAGTKKFIRRAAEIAEDKTILNNLDISDIYDIGYTEGTEAILKEKTALILAKQNQQ